MSRPSAALPICSTRPANSIRLRELLAGVAEDKADQPVVAAVRAKIAMARQVKELGDPVKLSKGSPPIRRTIRLASILP